MSVGRYMFRVYLNNFFEDKLEIIRTSKGLFFLGVKFKKQPMYEKRRVPDAILTCVMISGLCMMTL